MSSKPLNLTPEQQIILDKIKRYEKDPSSVPEWNRPIFPDCKTHEWELFDSIKNTFKGYTDCTRKCKRCGIMEEYRSLD